MAENSLKLNIKTSTLLAVKKVENAKNQYIKNKFIISKILQQSYFSKTFIP